jgi:alkyl sulfatase BDS1-like metallo-beta-lactamase superfamily hydrolase
MSRLGCAAVLVGALLAPGLAQAADATPATLARQAQAAAAPEFADKADLDHAARGFLGTRADPVIRSAAGAAVWNLAAYDFLEGAAPGTAHPGLWRQSQLLARHGLFEVRDGIYQVRGFDLANATFVRGRTGWIVIDALSSAETARAAYELVTEKLGRRPIAAVVYTHSHSDHFAGAGGLVSAADAASRKVQVIAPEGFMEAVASENITAGPAMSRRATYQFGVFLPRGPAGQVSAGIGPGLSRGTTALIPPNVTVTRATRSLVVDGVTLEFQLTPETEAPAEMNIFLPQFAALCMAENANATLHNILTPRGALVRDAKAWADHLTASARLFGGRTEVMFTSHAWPRFGRAAVSDFLAKHRDAYKFLHDQTVRLMNQGLTGEEIAARLELPPALGREWYNHGFYGTVSFNSRAVYQRYMGWYDANPVNLAAMPREERARRYVSAMGGRAAVARLAQQAFDQGDYAWAAELGDRLVFADPADAAAKGRLAEAYEQLGYQAESSLWRNMYLSAADELRNGVRGAPASAAALIQGAPLPLILDATAVRLDPGKAGDSPIELAIVLTDTRESAHVSVANGVMIHQPASAGARPPQATLSTTRPALVRLLAGGAPALAAGSAESAVTGDPAALRRWLSALDPPAAPFAIVTP